MATGVSCFDFSFDSFFLEPNSEEKRLDSFFSDLFWLDSFLLDLFWEGGFDGAGEVTVRTGLVAISTAFLARSSADFCLCNSNFGSLDLGSSEYDCIFLGFPLLEAFSLADPLESSSDKDTPVNNRLQAFFFVSTGPFFVDEGCGAVVEGS